MSATAEMLIEQVRQVKEKIAAAQSKGEDTKSLMDEYKVLWDKFAQAQQSLNESKQVLKG